MFNLAATSVPNFGYKQVEPSAGMTNESPWISNRAGGCTTVLDETSSVVFLQIAVTIAVRIKVGWWIQGLCRWELHLFYSTNTPLVWSCLICFVLFKISLPQLNVHHALTPRPRMTRMTSFLPNHGVTLLYLVWSACLQCLLFGLDLSLISSLWYYECKGKYFV